MDKVEVSVVGGLLTAIVSVSVLFACTTRAGWDRPGATRTDFYHEEADCIDEVTGAPADPKLSLQEVGEQQQQAFANCLLGKGWRMQ